MLVVVLLVALGVLFQARFRGGTSPEDVARQYVQAARTGDRITLFLLTQPGRDLTPQFAAKIERYRDTSKERFSIAYEPHSVAAYLVTVVVALDGRRFDEVALASSGRRWYIVHVSD